MVSVWYTLKLILTSVSVKEVDIYLHFGFQPPFKFCMQLGTQGGCTKMPF